MKCSACPGTPGKVIPLLNVKVEYVFIFVCFPLNYIHFPLIPSFHYYITGISNLVSNPWCNNLFNFHS
ncbi:hypothetical protein CW304_13925 [Bacillus sp. UFRGS-B20]|nr:hypothetical protein CW304_13925 [Bacillus sp. UFRGS-B20]